jgi:hypothetical protein
MTGHPKTMFPSDSVTDLTELVAVEFDEPTAVLTV